MLLLQGYSQGVWRRSQLLSNAVFHSKRRRLPVQMEAPLISNLCVF